MLTTVRKFIEKEKLTPRNATIILGLSGGADSMALLDVLTLLGYRCVAAHCNFRLRDEESNRDADFVKKWCKDVDIEFTSIDFDTHQYAADKKISIEMAARELRYSWFEIIRKQFDADAIAVAHHKDDSVETVLLNLIRGTGIKGLTGISPKNGRLVRPFLCVSRLQIEAYIAERNIPHIFDSSNGDDTFRRNAIRLNIIPKMEELNPSAKDAIYRTSQYVSEAEKMYLAALAIEKNAVFDGQKIHIPALIETPSPQSILFEILSPLGFTPSVVEDISQSLSATAGKVFYGGKYRLIKARNYFLIDESDKPSSENSVFLIDKLAQNIIEPIQLKINLVNSPKSIQKNKNILYADADKLDFPLTLRKWRAGDWFIPFGMKGKKKLSDFFTDQKFNLKEKEETWILLSGDDVVWIVGERADNRFRVTDKTTSILTIEIKPSV